MQLSKAQVSQSADDAGESHASQSVPDEPKNEHTFGWTEALRITAVAFATIAVRFRLWEPAAGVSVLGLFGVVIGGWPIFKEAGKNLVARRMTMELSMTIAIAAAAAISAFFTALIITLFVLIAEVLENLTVTRGRRAIRELLDFLPRRVIVRGPDGMRVTSADDLRAGASVLVNPGGLVPVDGVVLSGHSFVDQARITGESMPVEKLPGAKVYAGTVNHLGALEIRVERIGRDTSYGRIIEAVERAERSRAPVQRLADRLAGYLVYFALAAAVVTFFLTWDVRSTISVVIVAGACGIAAGTPLAILGGIGRAARLGAIIKGGVHLETLGRVDTVVLDKTGTLTFGRPEVQDVIPLADISEAALLETAAAAELRSEHPLGKAIVARASAAGRVVKEPRRFQYRPGHGIAAVVDNETVLVGNRALMAAHGVTIPQDFSGAHEAAASEVFVARDGRCVGALVIADTVRPEAHRAVTSLRDMGIGIVLLTGDINPAARAVAQRLGITQVEAEVLPEAKLARVEDLVAVGRVVAMVGDGINDAPALAKANVGVAMGSGADVARESADVVLLGNDLSRFADTVAIARRTRRIIWWNFAGTIAVDLAGIGLAAAGLLDPTVAAFIHVASEMIFILNSARLLPDVERKGRFVRKYS